MHRLSAHVSLILPLLLAALASPQQKPAPPRQNPAARTETSPAKPGATAASSANLPSEETVNAFLQQMFGYDSSASWKVAEIKPSVAEGLAELQSQCRLRKGRRATSSTSLPTDSTR